MSYIKFEKLKGVLHGFSLRHGGVSSGYFASLNLGFNLGDDFENVSENWQRFCHETGVNFESLCIAEQEHTDKVLVVREGAGLSQPFSGIDGFITDVPGICLAVKFADCQGVLMFDPVRKVIAAVHSGWRGNAQNIIGEVVRRMVREFGCEAADILVAISPSLGPCCAEFTNPHKELPGFMEQYISGRNVDLWQCSFDQLVCEGVLPLNIEIARRCTVCENSEFFSYRGGGKLTGHMGAVIQL